MVLDDVPFPGGNSHVKMWSSCAGDAPSTGGTPRRGTSQAVRAKGVVSDADEVRECATRNGGIFFIPGGGGRAGSSES